MKKNIPLKITILVGLLSALYVVLGATIKIPTGVGHVWFDLGYLSLAAASVTIGPWAALVGAFGALIESALFSGWGISWSWTIGNLIVGAITGFTFKYTKKYLLRTASAVIAFALGILLAKTAIEIALGYGVWAVKLGSNGFAAAMDLVVFMVGVTVTQLLANKLEVKR